MNLEFQKISHQTKLPTEYADKTAAFQVVSDFLDRNPLYSYVRHCRSGDDKLKVVLYGRSPLRRAFFDIILSTAQILDTQLHLDVIAPDAGEFWDQVKITAPLLKHVVSVDGDDCSLDVGITGRNARGEAAPFAHLRFLSGDRFSAPDMLSEEIGCLILLESCDDAAGVQLQQFAAKVRLPLLVGLCRDGGIDLGNCGQNQNVVIRTIAGSDDVVHFQNTAICRKAFGIHSFYAKDYNERENIRNIKKDFHSEKNDFYNLRSSVRSALSIPYKLFSCGLSEHDIDRFHQEVLISEDQRMLNRLIWLEHRSWQAYLILDGWTTSPDDFGGGFADAPFSQKCSEQKWHACLQGSDDTGSSSLEKWDLAAWDHTDIDALDPLDRISVQIHRRLNKKVEMQKDALDACLNQLKDQLPASAYQQICNVVEQLRNGVTNAQLGWKLLQRELPEEPELKLLVEALIERNACRDYKKFDRAIIVAIPYLLLDHPFQCVYSLYSSHPWNNVGVSVFLEPQELIMLTDACSGASADEQKRFLEFLCDRRGMDTRVSALPVEQLCCLQTGAVLDVTGATAEQLLRIQKHPLLKTLPLVACHNGGLISPDDSCPHIRYYPQNRSITVEEMMALSGTKVLSENSEIPIHGMYRYKELWNAVQKMSLLCKSTSYNALCEYLCSITKPCSVPGTYQSWDTEMPEEIAVKFGLCKLLEDMKNEGLIQPYTTHRRICPSDAILFEDLRKVLDEIEQTIRRSEQRCSFSLVTRTNPDEPWKRDWQIRCNGVMLRSQFTFAPADPWILPCTEAEAGRNGLAQLLSDLDRIGLLKPFGLHPGERITAADSYHQSLLNQLLDVYMDAVRRSCQDRLFLNLMPENPDDLCVLEDRSLEVKEINAVVRHFDEGALRDCLKVLKDFGLITNLQEPGPRKPYSFSFKYSDYPTKNCLTKTGNVLEALTYHTIRNMNVFDDVKLGVSIRWDRQNIEGKDTQNEIDVICTKGTKSWFFSCKQTFNLDKLQLNEILYEAERFGINATPILVTTAQRRNNPSTYTRAERMGIHIITLTKDLYHKDHPVDSVKELETQLLAILGEN